MRFPSNFTNEQKLKFWNDRKKSMVSQLKKAKGGNIAKITANIAECDLEITNQNENI